MEYAIYPFDNMRITQRHDEGNHLAHWSPFKNCSDKPWDEATEDGGRGYFVPKNDYKLVEKSGKQSTGYNVRLETCNKVKIPYQEEPVILEITLTHLNYDDWSKLSNGQIIKKGQKIMREGTSGNADGNHFHCTANIGKYYGLIENGNKDKTGKGKYCFTYDKALIPTEAFYIDDSVKILNAKKYVFEHVPDQYVGVPVEKNTKVDQINVKVTDLRARETPGLKGKILGLIKPGIYNIESRADADGYTWFKVQNMWIAYKPDWEILLCHELTVAEIQQDFINKLLDKLPEWINSLIDENTKD